MAYSGEINEVRELLDKKLKKFTSERNLLYRCRALTVKLFIGQTGKYKQIFFLRTYIMFLDCENIKRL